MMKKEYTEEEHPQNNNDSKAEIENQDNELEIDEHSGEHVPRQLEKKTGLHYIQMIEFLLQTQQANIERLESNVSEIKKAQNQIEQMIHVIFQK